MDTIEPPRLRATLLTLRLALLRERLAAACWLPASVAALALALGLSGLLPALPGWLHAGVLGLVAAGVAVAVVAGWRGFRWPTAGDARRRLDRSAPHRPLSALDDRRAMLPDAVSDPATAALWQAHRRRMAAAVGRLRAPDPVPVLAARDPWGLRAAAGLALVLAAAGAWRDPGERLAAALHPALGGPTRPPSVDIWVTPPAYTGLGPLYRQAGGAAPPPDVAGAPAIRVPEGSTLLVLVHGGDAPEITVAGDRATPQALADGTYRAETVLAPTPGPDARLTVDDGAAEAVSWPLEVTADRPPRIAFAAPPDAVARGRLRLPLRLSDDFGVVGATLRFTRPGEATEERSLPLAEGAATAGETTVSPVLDLAAHPWAGLEVEARLTATDAKGQEGHGDPLRLTLPERQFDNPLAQRLAALRRRLMTDPDSGTAVAAALEEIAGAPQAFDGDTVVFLGVTVAARRLAFGAEAERAEVIPLLWEVALRVEDGNLAETERALAEAERALDEALRGDAPAAEIADKLRQLREALRRYMQALTQSLPQTGADSLPPLPDGALSAQDLDAMLRQIGDLGALGARDAAQAMLDQVRRMLGALREAQPMPAQALQQIQRMMHRLEDLAKAQEELLNRTFQDHRDSIRRQRPAAREPAFLPPLPGETPGAGEEGPPAYGPEDDTGLAAEQDALRRRLGRLLEDLAATGGTPPQSLGAADQAMGEAVRALAGDAWATATEAQGAAVQALRDGSRQAMQRMMRSLGAGMAVMPGAGPGLQTDPLGRATGGIDAPGVKIPSDAAASEARDIMMELRRRSNDRDREAPERDYIRRLLDRF
jgi:uncharacterized protein (TIGR02302 family)